ncbi:unnamed protein product [Closterium sp. NIES-64]|nr:unnamed protein product [Closterium sp. NIES-64]
MYIALYYVVARLPDSLRVVRDHFLAVCPTTLTVDLLEKALLAAEKSIVAVGASRGDPRTPIFEGCSPSPLLPSVASAAAADLLGLESVGAASAPSGRRRSSKGKGGKGAVVEVVVVVAAVAETVVVVPAVVVEAAAVVEAAEVEAVEAAAEEAVVVEEVELVEVVPSSVAEVVVASARNGSSSSARGTSLRLSSFVSGTLGVRGVGVLVPAPTFFVPATARVSSVGCPRHPALLWPPDGRLAVSSSLGLVRSLAGMSFSGAGVAIFDLDFDAILAAMYVVDYSEETEGYRCFQPDPGIGTAALGACEAAALGASASVLSGTGETALSGTASSSSSLTFTLDSGASRSFFRDRTTLTPLGRPVAVSLANPSGGPVLSHFSTVLPCPAAPSGTLSGLYLPSFSTNLVSGADLQDVGVHQFTPASQRVTHCTEARTGRHLATFSRRPGSSLYTLTVESPPVPASGQVAASGQVLAAASRSGLESAPCSCRLLSHETLLWHHRLGHPSLPRLRSMASRVLVSGLPQSLLPLPSGPGPSCVPCVEGRLRATPHSSHFPPTEAPLQTLHMDVWGPAPVRGQGYERYFLLWVDDYSRYTTVLPLRSKGEVTEVLIDWIREARLQLRKSFGSDFPVLRLHSDRGGEFSSRLLRDYCRARGIRQTFTLPDSPQQNGIAERRIGMVMDVARTSMMHVAAPHFLWPFAVRYAAHQLNLHPRVSRPAMSPALLWTGKVGDASVFRVWGSRAFVRDLSADKLSPRAAPCVFLGFPTDAPGWQFYHPSSRRVLSSQDVTFDESVPFYRLFPYRTPSLPPPPDFLVPTPLTRSRLLVTVVLLRVLSLGGADSGGAVRRGTEPGGATAGGAGPEGTGSGGAGSGAAEPGGAELGAAEPGGAASGAAEPAVSPAAASRREPLSPQELREWFARRWRRAAESGGAAGAGAGASSTVEGAGATGPGAAGPAGPPGAGVAEGAGAGPTAVGPAAGGVGGASAVAKGAGAVPAASGAAARPRPYFVPLLQQVLGLSPPVEGPPPVQSQSLLEPSSPLPAPSPYTGPTGGLAERREPASRPASPVRTARASGTQFTPLFLRLPTLSRTLYRAASPTVTRLLATVVTDPSFESTAASALVTELVDFAARCHLDYAASLVAESASVCPPSVGGECALGTDGVDYFQTFSPTPKMTTLRVLLHIAAQRDYELHSLDFSTAFLQGSLHEEIWLRRPPGFTGTFPPGTQWSLRRPVYGLRQAPREWHDTLRTTLAALGFAPSTADPSLFLRTDTSLPPFYILVYVDDLVFATADTAGLAYVKSEL